MAVGMTVGPAVAYGKLGSLMGLCFFNVDVPYTSHNELWIVGVRLDTACTRDIYCSGTRENV